MIIKSSPGSITWQEDFSHEITFFGEWTLEPKFHLTVPIRIYWDGSMQKTPLSKSRAEDILEKILQEAEQRKWLIVIHRAQHD